MNTKRMYTALVLFSVICAAAAALPAAAREFVRFGMSFPFEQIAMGLRALSLSGRGGNAAAIILYILVCLLPGTVMLLLRKRDFHGEDSLLGIFILTMFAAIYFMINPSLICGKYGSEFFPLLRMMLGGACWCVLICWIVLRIVRRSMESRREGLQRLLKICLGVSAFVLAAIAFGGSVSEFISSGEELKAANTDPRVDVTFTIVFLAVQTAVNALPYALDAVLAVKGMELMSSMNHAPYSGESVRRAEIFAGFASLSLVVTVVLSLAFNLLQLVYIKRLLAVDIQLVIPVFSMAFMLAALLIARLIRENKALKDDNDMFI